MSTTKRLKPTIDEEAEEEVSLSSPRIRPSRVFIEFPTISNNENNENQSIYTRFEPEFTHQVFPEDDLENENLKEEDMVEEIDVDYCMRYSSSWNACYFIENREKNEKLFATTDDEEIMILNRLLENSQVGGLNLKKNSTPLSDEPWNLSNNGELISSEKKIFNNFFSENLELRYIPKICESEAGKTILSRGQALSTWLIETAEPVDFAKPDSRWGLMYAYFPKSKNLIGYTTIYPFLNLSREKSPITLRLCQIVVIPTMQGMGIGKTMLKNFYALGRKNEEVYEMNLEDPCPACQSLRDRVDFEDLKELNVFGVEGDDYTTESEGFRVTLNRARDVLKITKSQLYRAIDAVRYAALKTALKDLTAEEFFTHMEDERLKAYRVDVKRRFYRLLQKHEFENENEKKALFGDKEALKLKLDDMFRRQMKEYEEKLLGSRRNKTVATEA